MIGRSLRCLLGNDNDSNILHFTVKSILRLLFQCSRIMLSKIMNDRSIQVNCNCGILVKLLLILLIVYNSSWLSLTDHVEMTYKLYSTDGWNPNLSWWNNIIRVASHSAKYLYSPYEHCYTCIQGLNLFLALEFWMLLIWDTKHSNCNNCVTYTLIVFELSLTASWFSQFSKVNINNNKIKQFVVIFIFSQHCFCYDNSQN